GGGLTEGIPPLFFATVDIRHCYDTVDQEKLMQIVRPLVRDKDYLVQKYTKVHLFRAMNRLQITHVKEACPLGDMKQFGSLSRELAEKSTGTIFTDGVVYGIVSREEVLGMLEKHIFHHMLKVPSGGGRGKGAFFHQAVGIPQGSVLSGLLCSYFFGHIEKKLLGPVLGSGGSPGGQELVATASTPDKGALDTCQRQVQGLGHDPGSGGGFDGGGGPRQRGSVPQPGSGVQDDAHAPTQGRVRDGEMREAQGKHHRGTGEGGGPGAWED
ncbi:unnamed protein product, partial [Discosporangium mesarthrocarpum]